MTVVVSVIGRTGDLLRLNGQDKGPLDEQGRLIDVDEGENTFAAYRGDVRVAEVKREIVDVGEFIEVDLRPDAGA